MKAEQIKEAVQPLRIGGVTLPNRYILAPMAGISNLPFRLLCHEMGAGLVCMEMVSAKAISYRNKKTFEMLAVDEGEHPVSLQLFGSDPAVMGEAAAYIGDLPIDLLDINMGCPAPKVVKNGDGSALLRNPVLAGRIIEACVSRTDKPVTVKIRKGFDDQCVNAAEIARIAQESGAAAVTVHGRTREQYYSGKADWEIIRRVKEAVRIPVIGNGDLSAPEDIERMEEQTGCDGFMIARGAQGNPWIFRDLPAYEQTGVVPPRPSRTEIVDTLLLHARRMIAYKGDYIGMREMRKHAAWYLAGQPHAARLRRELNHVETYAELEGLLREM